MWSWLFWVVRCAVLDFLGYFGLKTKTQTSRCVGFVSCFRSHKNPELLISLSSFVPPGVSRVYLRFAG